MISEAQYRELKGQMDRIERLLTRMVGDPPAPSEEMASPPAPITPEMPEQERIAARQAEGRWILQTQGMDAYHAYWKRQLKLSKKPRLNKAA